MRKTLRILLLSVVVFAGCQQAQKDTMLTQKGNPILLSRLTGDYWQLWSMQPDGSNLKQLTNSETDKRYPCWMQESFTILYRTNNNYAYILDTTSGQEQRILTNLGFIGSVCQSPVNQDLLISRFRTEVLDSSDLWLISPSGQNQRIITREVGLQYDPIWSPDGSRIAYISGHGYQTHELYIMDSKGKNKRRLTDNKALELLPAISPNGGKIAYVSDITGDYEIWLMEINGNNIKQLTNSKGIDTRPCWLPDGGKILFVSNRSGSLQLWIMNANGSDLRQVTTGAPSMDPAWRRKSDK